ncbi:MAG: hypothetical protein SFV17_10180 [Candidatus Obscuribacter sp.]|nr:hypothetical protein [Candidatus Obscuribacter sp.]
MKELIPLIPLLVLLYGIYSIAYAIRNAGGTVFDDLKILEASIKTVRNRSTELPPEIALHVITKLELAESRAQELKSLLASAPESEHKAIRFEIASALALVSQARMLVDKHSPEQEDEEDKERS